MKSNGRPCTFEGARSSEPEAQVADPVATAVARTATVVFPKVDGLAAQGVAATEGALDPGPARQSDLQASLAVAAHRRGGRAVAIKALRHHHALHRTAVGPI